MTEENNRSGGEKLGIGASLAYSAGMIPAAYCPALLTGWLMYFYYPGKDEGKVYMTLGAFVAVQFIGRVMDSVADPLVGYFSDRTRSRWGRRIPYIVFGAPPLAITMALMWFPLTDGPSMANNIWLGVNLIVFWLAYTVVVAPHLSLLPEIAPGDRERNLLGGIMGGGEVIGTLIGAAIFGMLIDKYKEGFNLGPLELQDGYKLTGVLAGLGILFLFWLTWWFVRERPYSEAKEVKLNFYQAARETLKNPTYPNFLIMISMLRLLVDVIFALLPYYSVRHLGLGEGYAAGLSAAIIVGAVIFFPLIVWGSNRFGKKRVFSLSLLSFAAVLPLAVVVPQLGLEGAAQKIVPVAVFALLAPGAAGFLVLSRVVLTDIMDFDEKVTGLRREAMYNGIEGLITKLAAGFAPMLVALNYYLFGIENGILTAFVMDAAIAFFAFVVFIPYPIRK